MNFIPNTDKDREEMMQEIGISHISELFKDIPQNLLLKENLNVKEGMSEIELRKFMTELSEKNKVNFVSFLGAGSYNHFIPSVVPHLVYRSEFYTAYTPYQPEISQGVLQAIYEYQTMICNLTGMDVANASMYDGASALAEAALMGVRAKRKKEVIISSAVNPEYKKVVKTYTQANSVRLKEVDFDDGITCLEKLKEIITDETAAVLIQNPNFFGCIEDLAKIGNLVHNNDALFIVCVSEPTSLGLLKVPEADIVVGEGQSFGNPMSYGGPYLGFMATKKDYMRQLPGRLVGATVDEDGERGYVLTLQAREQHIRRDKATSNICSNEALCALAATVYLSTLGKNLKRLAELNVQKANYALNKLKEAGLKETFTNSFYNEFVVKCDDAEAVNKELLKNDIVGGYLLEKEFPSLKDCLLFCVTEMITKEEIDKMVEVIKSLK